MDVCQDDEIGMPDVERIRLSAIGNQTSNIKQQTALPRCIHTDRVARRNRVDVALDGVRDTSFYEHQNCG